MPSADPDPQVQLHFSAEQIQILPVAAAAAPVYEHLPYIA